MHLRFSNPTIGLYRLAARNFSALAKITRFIAVTTLISISANLIESNVAMAQSGGDQTPPQLAQEASQNTGGQQAAPTLEPAHDMSIISLVMDASLTVQLVMLALLLASFVSWSVIFTKSRTLSKENRLTKRFEKQFWAGGSMQQLYNQWGAETTKSCGMSEIFVAGYREYQRLSERGYANKNDLLDSVQRNMRVELNREIDHLESQIPNLATIGSVSPYVGLFGTVWGIMNSFRALGTSTEQATVASVAPGIAEALVATAMGLFAAIPAVVAYNRFNTQVEKLIGQYEIFMEEFISIINRQLALDESS